MRASPPPALSLDEPRHCPSERALGPGSFPSPFLPALGHAAHELPPIFRLQFLSPLSEGEALVFAGHMREIWHRPFWVTPLLHVLAWANILFPETGQNIDAGLRVELRHAADGAAGHWWARRFAVRTPREFNALMVYDADVGAVTERMGPRGFIQIAWNVVFLPPRQIEITTRAGYLRSGHRRLTLPAFLYPHVRALETAVADDSLHIDLQVSHVLFGTFFGYDGTFRVRRQGGEG